MNQSRFDWCDTDNDGIVVGDDDLGDGETDDDAVVLISMVVVNGQNRCGRVTCLH